MAATASFKQQCPSCEAMVPIRDANLIGRKIDCPKCKYRFVVEDPGTAADEEEAPKVKRRGEDGAAKKGAKSAVRRREEDDEDEDGKDAKPGGNNKLMLGVGLSVVAVALLAVVAYFLFFNDSSSSTSKTPSSAGSGGGSSSPSVAQNNAPAETPKEEKKEEAPAASTANTELLTNLLPPETEGVCRVNMQDLLKNPLGRAIFNTAGSLGTQTPGGFSTEALRSKLGFLLDDVDVIVQGWNFHENWSLNVVHSTKPLDLERVKAALHAKPVDEKIEGQDYFTLENNPWVDMLGHTSFALLVQANPAMIPVHSGQRAMRVYDEQTLVFADMKPMQLFLSKKGVFEKREVAPPASDKPKDGQEAAGERGSGRPMSGMPGGMPGMGRGGMPGMPGGQEKPEEAPAGPSGAYLTINPALKTMLDRVEAKQPFISLALDTVAAARARVPLDFMAKDKLLNLAAIFQDANIVGAALQIKDGITFTLGASYKSDDDHAKHLKSMQKQDGPDLASLLAKGLATKVDYIEESDVLANSDQGGFAPGMQGMPGMGMPGRGGFEGGQPAAAVGGGPQPGMGRGGRGGKPPMIMGGPPGGGMGAPGMTMPGMGRGMGMPGGMMQPGDDTKKEEKPGSTVAVSTPEKSLVIITIHLIDQSTNSKLINRRFRQLVMQHKGNLDMAGGQFRIHELGVAVRSYPESHKAAFPRGTLKREIPATRDGRPYPPDQRISWMAELLPYLGPEQQALYGQIEREQSWRHDDNLPVASSLVPQFLDPEYPAASWWAKVPGSNESVATTHFVGIAGVGLDAAEYSDGEPTVANKLGIFGYDRETRLADITDKTSNTIFLIQVPPTYKRPWMAGGGSTVMGVPETGSVRPFVSTQRGGKRGTYALMADGSVRWISENISDETFKALCTIKGGEQVIVNRDAPLVPPPEGQPELKVIQPPPITPKAPTPPPPPPVKEEKKQDDSNKVTAILSRNCASCHSGPRPKGDFLLFAGPGIINSDAPLDKLVEQVSSGKMPKRPKPPLQPDDKTTLLKWAQSKG